MTFFSHSCSERLHLLGGPVVNLRSKIVGMNYSKRDESNIFFALDHEQLLREQRSLFGQDLVLLSCFSMLSLFCIKMLRTQQYINVVLFIFRNVGITSRSKH